MAIQIATTRQSLATYYGTLGQYIGTTTGAPGTAATPANESTGGSPAYARKATTWTPSTGGTNSGSAVTIDTPASTITHVIFCSGASGANMLDWTDTTDVVFSAQGQAVVTPTFVQT